MNSTTNFTVSNLFLHRRCQCSLREKISLLHKRSYLVLSTNDEDIGAIPSWLQDWELTLGLHATWPPALLQEYLKGVAKVCASFVREGKEKEIEHTSCCDVVVGLVVGLVAVQSRIRIFNNACLASRY